MRALQTLVLAVSILALRLEGAEPSAAPLARAHAHNDYEHPRPLLDALAQGFTSVEADIFLVNGKLLVAHDPEDIREERTLEKLYLEPLLEFSQKNNGRVYRNGPSITLLIDFKSEAETTYAALEPVLQRFAPILTRFRNERIETNAVTVILSGNRPRERLLAQSDRLAAFDGRLSDLGKNLPVSFMPLVSDNITAQFPSIRIGSFSEEDRRAFEGAIRQAHAEGRGIRFWATRDNPETWRMLYEAGADYINTDNLAGLAEFLRAIEKR
jgi:glycerophosphoryl diester phosphodiesterase